MIRLSTTRPGIVVAIAFPHPRLAKDPMLRVSKHEAPIAGLEFFQQLRGDADASTAAVTPRIRSVPLVGKLTAVAAVPADGWCKECRRQVKRIL